MTTRYFEADFATVEYDDETNIVISKMTDYPGETQFRKYMDSIITAVDETGCRKCVGRYTGSPTVAEIRHPLERRKLGPKGRGRWG